MRKKLYAIISDTVKKLCQSHDIVFDELPPFQVERAKMEIHGDYSSNVALITARYFRKKPQSLAKALADELRTGADFLSTVEIAGPGFINFSVKNDYWRDVLLEISKEGRLFGRSNLGKGKKVQVEFVSANPTGPLHVGHGRGAAIGDSLCNLLSTAGYQVEREYYINDVGTQMNTLGSSAYLRYRELLGEQVDFPDNHYKGDYLKDIAKNIADREGRKCLKLPPETAVSYFSEQARNLILEGIKKDLTDFNVVHDHWFSEKSLFDTSTVERAIELLSKKNLLYEEDGALWFKATAFGDEKDRVIIRGQGATTYFASDIAYHLNKLERGFDLLIDIWGADHHGYVPRLQAAIEALGQPREKLQIILVQLVSLIRGGKQVAMSTRAGEFVTIRELIDEVGKDAARFNFLTRRSNSHLDFDLDLAKSRNQENPVYYVQYAHARISSVFEMAAERSISIRPLEDINLSLLAAPEEIKLLKMIGSYPEIIEDSAAVFEPHRIAFYLSDLATALHNFYNDCRVLSDDEEVTQARLALISGVQQVLKNGLRILGVSAPDKM
ncbi:MAG: arginine--tRNA ligase [Pseudomonadota bacterium]